MVRTGGREPFVPVFYDDAKKWSEVFRGGSGVLEGLEWAEMEEVVTRNMRKMQIAMKAAEQNRIGNKNKQNKNNNKEWRLTFTHQKQKQ